MWQILLVWWLRACGAQYAPTYEPTAVPTSMPSSTYSPSYAPTAIPTSTFSPTHLPTAVEPTSFPTEYNGVVFSPQPPSVCLIGEVCRFGFIAQPIPGNEDDNLPKVDVFVENDSEPMDIVLLSSQTVQQHVIIEYTISADVPTADGYQVKVIDYLAGGVGTSSQFSIASYAPTPMPGPPGGGMMPMPTSPTLSLEAFKETGPLRFNAGDSVLQGETLALTLKYTGLSQDEDGEVVIQLCSGMATNLDSSCESPVDSIYDVSVPATAGQPNTVQYLVGLPFGLYHFVVVDLVHGDPSSNQPEASDLIYTTGTFEVVPYAPSPAPSVFTYSPTVGETYSPTYAPSSAPTYSPTTACTLQILFEDYFQIGEVQDITFRICGDPPSEAAFGLVDVLLVRVATLEVADVVVDYFQAEDEYTTITYTPPSTLVPGAYVMRGVEYTRNYDVVTDHFTIGREDYAPSPKPTLFPSSAAPTGLALSVIATKSNGDILTFDDGDAVLRGETLSVQLAYLGEPSARTGVATIRLCRGDADLDDCEIQGSTTYFVSVSNATQEPPESILVDVDDLGEDFRFIITSTVTPVLTFTGTFAVSDRRPTAHPTPSPTPSPTTAQPIVDPTSPPTTDSALIENAPSVWFLGTENEFTVVLTGQSTDGPRTVDVLLYQSEVLVDVLVGYESISPPSRRFTYDVPDSLMPGNDYVLRVVDYTVGSDISTPLSIVSETSAPTTSAPTRRPPPTYQPTQQRSLFISEVVRGSDGGTLDPSNPSEDFLISGDTVSIQVVSADEQATVSIGLCEEDDIDERVGCSDPIFVLRAVTTFPQTFVVPTDLDDDKFVLFAVSGGVVSYTGLFDVFAFAPTPEPIVTASPTSVGLIFTNLQDSYNAGESVDVDLTYVGGPRVDSRLDVVVYESSADIASQYVEPSDEVVQYAMIPSSTTEVSFPWTPRSDFPTGVYYMRAIDHEKGFDAISGLFVIFGEGELALPPTPAPISSPTMQRVALQATREDGSTLADTATVGETLSISLFLTSAGPDSSSTVSVRMCVLASPLECDEALIDTVAFGLEAGQVPQVVEYVVSDAFENQPSVVFFLRDETGFERTTDPFQVVSATGTLSAAAADEGALLAAEGAHVVPRDLGGSPWLVGETRTFDVVVDTSDIFDAVVDVGLFVEGNDSPVVVLADAAETTIGGVLTLSYAPTADLAGQSYVLRVYEFEKGFSAQSLAVDIVDHTPPTFQPTPKPTSSPTQPPTTSTILVETSVSSDFVAVGEKIDVDIAYTGILARSTGLATVRLCHGSSQGYGGKQSDRPIELCDTVDILTFSNRFERSGRLVESYEMQSVESPVYLRIDAALDRESFDNQLSFTDDEFDDFVLTYETASFFVGFSHPPTPNDDAEDSTTWYKWSSPSKDCGWVSEFERDGTFSRCDSLGFDDTYAYESCKKTCSGYQIP